MSMTVEPLHVGTIGCCQQCEHVAVLQSNRSFPTVEFIQLLASAVEVPRYDSWSSTTHHQVLRQSSQKLIGQSLAIRPSGKPEHAATKNGMFLTRRLVTINLPDERSPFFQESVISLEGRSLRMPTPPQVPA